MYWQYFKIIDSRSQEEDIENKYYWLGSPSTSGSGEPLSSNNVVIINNKLVPAGQFGQTSPQIRLDRQDY